MEKRSTCQASAHLGLNAIFNSIVQSNGLMLNPHLSAQSRDRQRNYLLTVDDKAVHVLDAKTSAYAASSNEDGVSYLLVNR